MLKPPKNGIVFDIYYWKSKYDSYGSFSFIGISILMHPSFDDMYGVSPRFFIEFIAVPMWKSAILTAFFGFRSNTIILSQSSANTALNTSELPP